MEERELVWEWVEGIQGKRGRWVRAEGEEGEGEGEGERRADSMPRELFELFIILAK